MKESRKIEVLTQIREILDQGEHATLREIGLSEEEAQELASEQLLEFGDKRFGETLDRLVVARLETKAIVFLTTNRVHRTQHVIAHSPPKSVGAKIAEAFGKKLWDFSWDVLKIFAGVVIGWVLKTYFP